MYVDQHYNLLHDSRASLSMFIAPIRMLAAAPDNAAHWAENNVKSFSSLAKENQCLQEEQFLLQAKLQQVTALKMQNQALLALLRSRATTMGPVTVARVLSTGSNPFSREVVINKGSKDKVYNGQVVLDARGVMGQVIAAEPWTSRVMLLDAKQSAVPVTDTRSGEQIIVSGTGHGELQVKHVPDTTTIKKGDKLITSGLGQRFPAGYPVSVVSSVVSDSSDHFATITVEPSAGLDTSREVLLLWPKANSEKQPLPQQLLKHDETNTSQSHQE